MDTCRAISSRTVWVVLLAILSGTMVQSAAADILKITKISSTQGGMSKAYCCGADFGESLGELGDVDGDGIMDVIVGAEDDSKVGVSRGAAYILFLNSDGTVRAHQKITSGIGGFVGDLYDGIQFGNGAGGVGDIDGDGIPDAAVGVSKDDTGGANRGAVWLLLLNRDGTVRTERKLAHNLNGFGTGLRDSDAMGASIDGLGDLDGDSVPDFVVGTTGVDGGGGAYILFMNNDGTVKSKRLISRTSGHDGNLKIASGNQFGQSVANLGDLDGDGVTDMLVGGQGSEGIGAFWILYMNTDGTVRASVKQSTAQGYFATQPLLELNDNFGQSVKAIGDLDGDGVTEIAVGAEFDGDGGSKRGAVYVLFLNRDGSIKTHEKLSAFTPQLKAWKLDNSDNFGQALARIGDLNRDGTPDLMVMADGDNDGGKRETGAAYVVFFKPTTTTPPPAGGPEVFRLRAGSIPGSVGNLVTTWADASPSANSALCAGSCPRLAAAIHSSERMVAFTGTDQAMTIPDKSGLNLNGPFTQKTVILAFETGPDVTSRQVVYEQGGRTRGLGVYLNGGRLFLGAWNTVLSGSDAPWGPVFLQTPVSANTAYVAVLEMDQPSGVLRAYVNGGALGSAGGVGRLHTHDANVGIGAMVDGSRFADLDAPGSGYYFNGRLGFAQQFNVKLAATDLASQQAALMAQYGVAGLPSQPVPAARLSAFSLGLPDGSPVTQWLDDSGLGNHASCSSNCPVLASNAFGAGRRGVAFDGVDDVMRIANSESINTGLLYRQKTLALVFRTGADVSRTQLLYEQGGTTRGISVHIHAGSVHAGAWNAQADDADSPWGPVFIAAPVAPSTTYVLTFALDGEARTAAAWLNGVSSGQMSGVGAIYQHTGSIAIGNVDSTAQLVTGLASGGAYHFGGWIGELRLYNQRLTAEERSALEEALLQAY